MRVTEVELEEKAKGLRVSLGDVHHAIQSEYFFTAEQAAYSAGYREIPQREKTALGLVTFCVLVMKNGYTVTGQSACADPKNYDQAIGRRLAKEHAINQVWPLLGYELRTTLDHAERAFKA